VEVVDGHERPGAVAVRDRVTGQLASERNRLARRERVGGAGAPAIRAGRRAQALRSPRDRLPAGERQLGEDRMRDSPGIREDVRAFGRRRGKAAKPEVDLCCGAGVARLG